MRTVSNAGIGGRLSHFLITYVYFAYRLMYVVHHGPLRYIHVCH